MSPVSGADQGHQVQQPAHGPLVGAAHRQHDAELAGPQRRRFPGRAEHLVGVEERGGEDRRVEAGRLGAEVAVLRAPARLGRQDALHLDGVAAPGQADLVGQGGQGRHQAVGNGGQLGQLARGEPSAIHDQLVSRRGDDVESGGRKHGWTW